MKRTNRNIEAFFTLVKAGLWEQEVRLSGFEKADFKEVCRIAEEQSVAGLVAAGIEHIEDICAPKQDVLTLVGKTLQLERRNLAMNEYVSWLIEKLREENIYALLVKGQGIAQCYERPLWRVSGDVDLLLDSDNYERAKILLLPLAIDAESEYKAFKHLGMTMKGGYVVELHGSLHTRLSGRVDSFLDALQMEALTQNRVRTWRNGKTDVYIPAPEIDAIFVFTHILHHFYIEGIGIRQICDWCRLLWTYRDAMDMQVLESRIRSMGLMSEWKAFGTFAVEYLGMPAEAMPLYVSEVQDIHEFKKFKRKAERIMEFVLESGNFGHNRDIIRSRNYLVGKILAAWYKMKDFGRHALVFPLDSVKFFFHFLCNGIGIVSRSE